MRKLAGCKYKRSDSRHVRADASEGLVFSIMARLSGHAK
jgi:hypothetical protein